MPTAGPQDVQITEIDWRDFFRLRSVFKFAFGRDAWSDLDMALALLAPDTVRLFARRGEQVVGFVIGAERRAKVGWIAAIGVLPEARREGVATRLLLECEMRLKTPVVRLTLRRSNMAASELYEKHGYRLKTVWPRYYKDGEDGLVLEKDTSQAVGRSETAP